MYLDRGSQILRQRYCCMAARSPELSGAFTRSPQAPQQQPPQGFREATEPVAVVSAVVPIASVDLASPRLVIVGALVRSSQMQAPRALQAKPMGLSSLAPVQLSASVLGSACHLCTFESQLMNAKEFNICQIRSRFFIPLFQNQKR